MGDNDGRDEQIAAEVRSAVNNLNETLVAAAHANLSIRLRTTVHQTSGGAELVVVEADILKKL